MSGNIAARSTECDRQGECNQRFVGVKGGLVHAISIKRYGAGSLMEELTHDGPDARRIFTFVSFHYFVAVCYKLFSQSMAKQL